MRSFLIVLFSIIFVFISACKKEQTSKNINIDDLDFQTEFKAPQFEKDRRKEIILELAPKFNEIIKERANAANIPGIAFGVVVDDKLVHTFSTGKMNLEQDKGVRSSSVFRIASMTKSFTAMAIMKLKEEGKLALDDRVDKYIPEMKNLKYLTRDASRITIENLLTMTAGFPEDNPWGDRQLDESDEMLLSLMEMGVSFSNVPAYTFEYSNTGYALLGMVISKVSGIPYGEYIRNELLIPLGMNNTYWEIDSVPAEDLALGYRWEDEQWKIEPMLNHGSYGSMGGLNTSIQDFAKYVSFQLSAWPPRNDIDAGPVKRSSLRAMQTPQFSGLYTQAKNFSGEDCPIISGYGYGLGIRTYCDGLKYISHGGALPGFGSNYVMFPEYGIGFMAFCNLTYTSPWDFNAIAKILFESEELEKRKLSVSNILEVRKEQLLDLIQNWPEDLEKEILAENFYLDRDREDRMESTKKIWEEAGALEEVGELRPMNQLRGDFGITTENGEVRVYFTLSPEKDPKIQYLSMRFIEEKFKEN